MRTSWSGGKREQPRDNGQSRLKKYHKEPMENQSLDSLKHGETRHWFVVGFIFCIWLVERVARDFQTNHQERWGNPKPHQNIFIF